MQVPSALDEALRKYSEGRLLSMRTMRYSWWTHWRELADYILPRRYKWLITPNQMNRGSPINQHILDSTATLAARNLSSGMVSGISSPTRPWFHLKIGRTDSTQTSPASIWLADCERILMLIFHESNFYSSIATAYFDLVVFGTAVILIYENFENVAIFFNPCAGEYYLDLNGEFKPVIFYREFIMTASAIVDEFGKENCSETINALNERVDGSGRVQEAIVAHAIEPNTDPAKTGIPAEFAFYECYWEWGNSTTTQGGGTGSRGFLRKKGYHEQLAIPFLWDLVANDPYGRSPAMDALPDVKQLQVESRRKGQAIDKSTNPPMVADGQLKNQPASMLPGGFTFINGMMAAGKPGIAPAYGNWRPDISAMKEDLDEVRSRIRQTFFNDVLQTMAQLRSETSSNVTAAEVDATRAEALIMLGPVLERIEGALSLTIDRVFAMAHRAGILPPPPQEIQGQAITIEYESMLAVAQAATAAAGIERTLAVAGNLAGIDPAVLDGLDPDFALAKYSSLMKNDPRLIRAPALRDMIRQRREQQQQAAAQADAAQKYADSAKNLAGVDVGGGKNAMQTMMGLS